MSPAASGQPDLDFALDVGPLLGRPHHFGELVKRRRVTGGEFKPRDEVEGFGEITAVMQAARDSRQVREATGDVVGAILKDRAPLVLRQFPPLCGLTDRNQCRGRRRCPPQRRLALGQRVAFGSNDVVLVIGYASERP